MQTQKIKQQAGQVVHIVQDAAQDIPLAYFFQLWENYWEHIPVSDLPFVLVTDTDIPELYVRACGAIPVYLFGGSYYEDPFTDQLFPQICNPVLKSTAGMLLSKQLPLLQNIAGIAMMLRNVDDRKTLPYLKEIGLPVFALEQDTMLSDKMPSSYRDAQMHFLLQLEAEYGVQATISRLYQEAELITNAHYALRRLDMTNYPEMIKSFIRQTYYIANDREEWVREVAALTDGKEVDLENERYPLFLMGSSIFFPNVKIPEILQELGLTHYWNQCGASYPVNYTALFQNKAAGLPELLEHLHQIHYHALRGNAAVSIYPSQVKKVTGIIYHLLKGQLSHAYEADAVEEDAIRQGIPFLCVETDYSDADREQIKVRLEGFAELLNRQKPKTFR